MNMKLRHPVGRTLRRLVTITAATTLAVTLATCGSTATTGAADSAAAPAPSSQPSSAAPAPSSADGAAADSAADTASSSAATAAPPGSSAAAGAVDAKSLLPADLAKKGVIAVGSDIEYPPFESYEADGKTVVGLDRDVADGLEKQLGVKLDFQNSAFDALIPGLTAGRYDMAMSAMTDTKEREKQVDFVDYVKAGGGILLPVANPLGIKTPDDLCGLNIAVDKGTTEVDDAATQSSLCTKAGKKPLNTSVYPGNNQMILALQTGRADAALIDSVSGEQVAHESNGKLIALPPYNESYFGIVFPKGSDQLQKAVQAGLQAMKADGSYEAIFKKYGLEDATVDDFTINGAITTSGGLGS